jgi:hypothetical protein
MVARNRRDGDLVAAATVAGSGWEKNPNEAVPAVVALLKAFSAFAH